ncbi:MAG: hypothetical protein IJ134_00005 [Bacilli bacterium]|nr:hypothetical protein [Bacilli bacterium]
MEFIGIKDPDSNYLYDIYIKNEKLMDGLQGSFELSLSKSLKLIKLLEYVPENWEIERLLETKVSDLKFNELRYLEVLRRDLSIAHAIKSKLKGQNYNEKLYDYATKIDIDKIIDYKFDVKKIKEKYSYALNSSIQNKLCIINEYRNKYDIPIEREVLLYFLEEDLSKKPKTK